MTTGGKNILVIDDDATILETLQLLLESEGYTVFKATNGKEGLELLETFSKPVLILLDLMMPVMNGWEFLEEKSKRSALKDYPVLVLTAGRTESAISGAQGIIRKPFDLDEFLAAVERAHV